MEKNNKCNKFTIYTEDFCISFGTTDKKNCRCSDCYLNLIKWLTNENLDKKSFFEI